MTPAIGMLCLEYGIPPADFIPSTRIGAISNHATFGFPVIGETVEGARVENVVRGDPTLEPAYVAAAKRLVSRGAIAISSDCGFSIRHQAAVAASVSVPVVMSSLLLAPTLLRQLPKHAKLAVITFDSNYSDEGLLGVEDAMDRKRIVIGGIEGTKYWHDGLKMPLPPTDVDAIEADVSACIARLRIAHPSIAAILLECASFPLAASVIRKNIQLPVYDITMLCRMTLQSIG
ncbi:hypothetical protein ACVWZ6_002658 [Bradyrhizobium sp. GM6.1]